jgi:hypothetical protein
MIKAFFKRIVEFVLGPEQPSAASKEPIQPVVIKRVVRVSEQEAGAVEAMLSDNDDVKRKENRNG